METIVAACIGPKAPRGGNILMGLWVTSITVAVYIIINHVMCYCLLLVTQPTEELLCVRALYLLTLANILHLSHFV